MNKTIPCPACGETLELKSKPGDPHRLIATHKCAGMAERQVYETDAPAWPPPELSDRLEPGEPLPPAPAPTPPATKKKQRSFS
jgi:hypothetical protein